jgi:hypothetical protein
MRRKRKTKKELESPEKQRVKYETKSPLATSSEFALSSEGLEGPPQKEREESQQKKKQHKADRRRKSEKSALVFDFRKISQISSGKNKTKDELLLVDDQRPKQKCRLSWCEGWSRQCQTKGKPQRYSRNLQANSSYWERADRQRVLRMLTTLTSRKKKREKKNLQNLNGRWNCCEDTRRIQVWWAPGRTSLESKQQTRIRQCA